MPTLRTYFFKKVNAHVRSIVRVSADTLKPWLRMFYYFEVLPVDPLLIVHVIQSTLEV